MQKRKILLAVIGLLVVVITAVAALNLQKGGMFKGDLGASDTYSDGSTEPTVSPDAQQEEAPASSDTQTEEETENIKLNTTFRPTNFNLINLPSESEETQVSQEQEEETAAPSCIFTSPGIDYCVVNGQCIANSHLEQNRCKCDEGYEYKDFKCEKIQDVAPLLVTDVQFRPLTLANTLSEGEEEEVIEEVVEEEEDAASEVEAFLEEESAEEEVEEAVAETEETQIQPEPVCRSLNIVRPEYFQPTEGQKVIRIPSAGFTNQELAIVVDSDQGAVNLFRYKSMEGTITFDNQGTVLDTEKTSVLMNSTDTSKGDIVTVWAMDEDLNGLQDCHDTLYVELEESTPEVVEAEVAVAEAEVAEVAMDVAEQPAELPELAVANLEPKTVYQPLPTYEPTYEVATLHAAAVPEVPKNGPEVIFYIVGALAVAFVKNGFKTR